MSFQVLIFLGIALLLFNHIGDYSSALVTITKDIKTPVTAGQRQHGSARWLRRTEYKQAFGTGQIYHYDRKIQYLIQHGYDDLEFLKKKEGRNGER